MLHAHIPYVRQPEDDITLEERWFCEAVADSYLPFIEMCDRLLADDVRFRLTLSLSPTLLDQLEDPLMQRKLRQHLAALRELSSREVFRLWGDADFGPTAIHYADRYSRLEKLYDQLGGDLIGKLRSLRDNGCVELITCAATHAFLPLVKNDAMLRIQLEAAVTEFRRHFGTAPAGIWLPECGYTPAVEPHLQALGLRFFVVDAHAWAVAAPEAQAGAPLRTRGGACAFARDPEASEQVWSAAKGYPGDADYREYYRDIGFDLGQDDAAEWAYIKPYVLPDGERIHTGLKYHRITGPAAAGDAKAPYHPARAAAKAQQHAEHFVASRVAQLRRLAGQRPAAAEPPVIVCPYDAELFGHWWYEGPQWLEAVLRGLDAARDADVVVSTTTLGAACACAADTEAELPVSSWGRGGYAEVWLQPRSQWVHPLLHAAEDRLARAARMQRGDACARALNQAARELMLAQSSDWTFILDADTFTTYAARRIQDHVAQCHQLLEAIEQQQIEQLSLLTDAREKLTPFLPTLDFRNVTFAFADAPDIKPVTESRPQPVPIPLSTQVVQALDLSRTNVRKLSILMLAWEYPPRVIGGLARAVCDLSEQLAASGHIIHVITCFTEEAPAYAVVNGVHVHRAHILQSIQPTGFLDWVFQMNLAFTDTILRLSQQLHFDVIHAHDWLVYYTAKEVKETLGLPLVATIHATEYGRNQGKLETETSQRIHRLEAKLMASADRLIVCSSFMLNEIRSLFEPAADTLICIPNGVQPFQPPEPDAGSVNPILSPAIQGAGVGTRIICFLGRLVHEKGVHVLIDAMPAVFAQFPNAKLVIAGAGPTLPSLQAQAAGLGERICFTGFLDEHDKRLLLHAAELCVFPSLYEPFGLVALEAMASCTPLIVSDTGGLAEIVEHYVDGFNVPPADRGALSRQIILALEQPQLAKALAQTGLIKVQTRYHFHTIRQATSEVYYQLADRFVHPIGIFRH
ncbi:1,4-alpha-glucan branching protein domain-containing protein [Paenibacillus aestuarii]|uniref:1,4-alpha-glucan branching protein domain-containing protein n=1 Tax=Paenibacillus aestuarii TaxID=516965 RepID=A0ABW0K9G9_9BACL|nr:1,4-alpha-glucan branching protein domain-containing protein [Paenibacillus aestuarii]